MSYTNILTEQRDSVFLITVNRPKSLNALTGSTIQEIGQAVESTREEQSITGIVITGAGEKAFVAGADISEFADYKPEQGTALSAAGHRVFNLIESFSKPVIAAVNGFALGGGCELAMSCHIRIGSENSRYGQPEVNLGIIPGYGGTMRLAELVGKGKAMELLLTADIIDAEEAHRIGLINHVVSAEELMAKAIKMAAKIGSKGPIAVALCISLINTRYRTEEKIGAGYPMESDSFGELMASADFKEGTKAFLEKRKAVFKGK
ncbi:MAG: enoyl-CoA hydratase [Limisphaerales bacterium]|jgi:enoyl-CoA hydratase